ncbi:MAG: hypothetical protein E7653_01340 [Ruminococcaceae bacterium]|nr:hypothetical protein [Oscillospiraceae bacterium]
MTFSGDVLRNEERAIYSLRELYRKYGYSQFKVSRFEEYDLYARNKSFLISENILTFTDTDGKLMALKPDVTLSIIKNINTNGKSTQKLYYNETVYRTSAVSHGFKEIMQTGLECVGYVDMLAESEVVMLAMRSLEQISSDHVLDVSHMGLIEGLLDSANIDSASRADILELVKSKNTTGIKRLCEALGVGSNIADKLCLLTDIYLPLSEALETIESCVVNEKMKLAYGELKNISEIMAMYGLGEKMKFDFSIVNDFNYYDGLIFKGFINSIPDSILSGGRYDKLLMKMGKRMGAIGFAVYLDRLERFGDYESEYDTDILLVYDEDADVKTVVETVRQFNANGKSVKVSAEDDKSVRYRRLVKVTAGGVEL